MSYSFSLAVRFRAPYFADGPGVHYIHDGIKGGAAIDVEIDLAQFTPVILTGSPESWLKVTKE